MNFGCSNPLIVIQRSFEFDVEARVNLVAAGVPARKQETGKVGRNMRHGKRQEIPLRGEQGCDNRPETNVVSVGRFPRAVYARGQSGGC